MDQSIRSSRSGPREVGRIVSEMFSFVMTNREAFDASLVETSAQMTIERLNEVCSVCRGHASWDGGDAKAALTDPPPDDFSPDDFAPVQKGPVACPRGAEQRRLHLLRLLSCKLSHAFERPSDADPIDRQASIGIDVYLRRLFGVHVYERLNEQAQHILLASGRGDEQVLRMIMDNYHYRQFLNNVLVRFGLSFRNFDVARHLLMADMNAARAPDTPEVGPAAFHTVTGALLNDLLLTAKSQDDGALLDFQFGPRTARWLDEVSERLAQDRAEHLG